MSPSIFVSIASYRDPSIDTTISQVINNSSQLNKIRCVVCLQDDKEIYTRLREKYPSVEFIHMPHEKARGVCYARALIQEKIKDETHYLQLDSHMMLSKGWDNYMLASLEHTYDPHGVISCYPPAFDPNDPSKREQHYSSIGIYTDITSFKSTHTQFKAGHTKNKTGVPIRAMHISGAFVFASTEWCSKVRYPKQLYYMGEEDWLRIRSYTYGFNVYCPEKAYVWHDYSQPAAKKHHWKDNGIKKDTLFDVRTIRPGNKRTMQQYMIAMKQFTPTFNDIVVPSKKNLLQGGKPSRIHITLFYHDTTLLNLDTDSTDSLDPGNPTINFPCTLPTLCMATKYRIECIGKEDRKIRYIEHDFLK